MVRMRIISKFVCFNFRKYCNLSESVWLCHGESWYMDNTYLYAQFWLHSIFSSHLCWFLPLFDSCRCWHSHTFVPPENYHLTVYKSFDDHFWQWMTSIVYHGECLHIDTHKRWQMANLVSNCVVNLWWLWMFMAYIYIQYTSVISLWGKATCIMFAGPRSLGQGYHFSSHLGGIWK